MSAIDISTSVLRNPSADAKGTGSLPTPWLLVGNFIAERDKIRVTSVATANCCKRVRVNKDTPFPLLVAPAP